MSEQGGHGRKRRSGISRRDVLTTGAAAGAAAAMGGLGALPAGASAQGGVRATGPGNQDGRRIRLVNGEIHTMDAEDRVVSSAVVEGGRFVQVGRGQGADPGEPNSTTINLKGRTVIPGIIDVHNHIVLVGNRPGHHVLMEDVFTIQEALQRYSDFAEDVPDGEWITTIGPIAARQFAEQRIPVLDELDAAVPDHPVYIQAAQGGTRTNSAGRALLEPQGVEVENDGTIPGSGFGGSTGPALALRLLREQLLTPETRRRSTVEALRYFTTLGITTHGDKGAFHSEEPAGGIATENTYTMHFPFLELDRVGLLPARVRIDFLHQDAADADPPLPTLAPRLRNSFQFFGNDWLRTGGIGEFTGGGLDGLRAIAAAGWRAEDHALSLNAATSLIESREIVHAEIPIDDLRWIISHIPRFTEDLANRFHAIGGGVLVGWGPLRTGMDVGPPYRMLVDHSIHVGWHSDGGDISVINPWLNLYTMITGRNLAGDHILGDQTITRREALRLATAANKWFTREDDLGSIEVGNHADLVVLDRDFFTVPEEDIKGVRSLLTVIGGRIAHNDLDGGGL